MSDAAGQTFASPWWQCAMCGTVVPSGSSHNCFHPATTTGLPRTPPPRNVDMPYSVEVALWTDEKIRADRAEAEVAGLRGQVELLTEAVNTECVTCIALRAAIEQLRDDVMTDAWWDDDSERLDDKFARRLTEILEGES